MKECTTFGALLKPLTEKLMAEAINRFDADYYTKSFKMRDQLIAMLYLHLYELKSLRDLEIAFNSQKDIKTLLNCSGVSRSTLSDANKRRPAECFLWIVEQLIPFLPRKKRKEINKVVKILDSSPIQLKGKGYDEWTLANRTLRCQGLKLHIEYDGQIEMPTRAKITSANRDDCSMGQSWPIMAEGVYVFDKGYYDFNWWWSINERKAFFVTRLKDNAAIKVIEDWPTNSETILGDSLFEFKNRNPRGGKRNNYVKRLRRIVVAREGKKPLVIVTNLIEASAEIIAELYKERWGVELFFKWIKQNLRIKKFVGRSENAVKSQLAIGMILYILMGIFKFVVKNKLSLHQLLIWIRYNCDKRKQIYKTIKPPNYAFTNQRYSGVQL
jgi:putative transposase